MLVTQATSPEERVRKRTQVLGVCSFVVMASAQIATPLSGNAREALTNVTVVAFAIAMFLFARLTWNLTDSVALFLGMAGLTLAVEAVAVRTGFPFGSYEYTNRLQPAVFDVPAIVPLAWFAMGLAAWEVAGRLTRKSEPARVAVAAAALTAWDVFLDPQMVANGYWVWDGGGPWRGVPISNYVGWFGTGLVVMTFVWALHRRRARAVVNSWAVGLYAWMAIIETLGFLLPFTFDDPLVGVVGGVAMVPLAIVALTRR